MSLGILTNVAATYAENSLNQTQSSLQTVLQQLSSGSRINSGSDDAAGLSISDGLTANEAALTQSAQNAQNGVGLLQTADGALSQVTNLLDRAVTLATEASNGGLTAAQSGAANTEYQSILTEIGNIGTSTNFNSTGVFYGDSDGLYRQRRDDRRNHHNRCYCRSTHCSERRDCNGRRSWAEPYRNRFDEPGKRDDCAVGHHDCYRGCFEPTWSHRRQCEPVERSVECGERGGGQLVLCSKLDSVDELRSGYERPGEVPGAGPDRHQCSCAGEQHAAGDSETAAVNRGRWRQSGESCSVAADFV